MALFCWQGDHRLILVATILVLGFCCGVAATLIARTVARRIGLVDRPDGRRKLQSGPVAVAGGIAVFFAVVFALLIAANLMEPVESAVVSAPQKTLALLVAAFVIAALGLVDDLVNLRARHKIVGQLGAVLILVVPGGFLIEQVTVFGHVMILGSFAIPVTVFWFLGAINAINLLDGMDGLLGTIGCIIFSTIAFMALAGGHQFEGWVALAMVGALGGFLCFNLPPATVYLGDCGSMLIGLIIAALAISASLKGPAVAILAPSALLVLPLLDTTAAIIRRKLTGRGLAVADRGHLHHEMLRRLLNRWWVLCITTALGVIGAVGALAGAVNDWYAIVSAAIVVLILLTTGLFGIAEVKLIKQRATAYFHVARGKRDTVELSVQLQGDAEWSGLWRQLVTAADELKLQSLRLDVNAPAWHEAFHGRWDRSDSRRDLTAHSSVWKLEIPVYGYNQIIGRLLIAGMETKVPVDDQLAHLSRILHATETILTPPPHPTNDRDQRPAGPVIPIPVSA